MEDKEDSPTLMWGDGRARLQLQFDLGRRSCFGLGSFGSMLSASSLTRPTPGSLSQLHGFRSTALLRLRVSPVPASAPASGNSCFGRAIPAPSASNTSVHVRLSLGHPRPSRPRAPAPVSASPPPAPVSGGPTSASQLAPYVGLGKFWLHASAQPSSPSCWLRGGPPAPVSGFGLGRSLLQPPVSASGGLPIPGSVFASGGSVLTSAQPRTAPMLSALAPWPPTLSFPPPSLSLPFTHPFLFP